MNELIVAPIVQYGFAGFCAVQLGVIVWMVSRFMGELARTREVVQENTAAVREVTKLCADVMALNRDVHDKLIARPCIAKGE